MENFNTTEILINLIVKNGYSEQEAIELLAKFLDENSTCETVSQDDVDRFIAKYSSDN